jgi:general secretion pathway protein H
VSGRERGFTLLELMVVILIVGVLAGLVSFGMAPSPIRQARQEAGAIVQLLHQLREKAVIDGREYGLWIGAKGYQAMVLGRPDWRAMGALHQLASGLSFELEWEGQSLALADQPDTPQVLLLSSDETSQFTLHFDGNGQRWLSISGDGLNDPVINEL